MPTKPNKLSQFWQELKRRKVIRVITVYAAVAFVILQLIEILGPSLRLPEWTMNFILVVLIVGFIITVIVSWIYDIHPEGGIVKTEPVHKVKPEDIPKSSNSWKIASYISFVVIIGLIVLNIIPRGGKNEIIDKSIAVLPFIDDSPDKNNEHIINGIMEDLLINLQSIKDLRIPGRTSIEQYRNNPKPIPEIAAEMNVAYILEGSGQRYGNRIRLRIQLVEGASDKHIWADSYDEVINGPEDIFRIQSQIAKSIAAELQAVITPEENKLIEKISTTSLSAYDYFQRGRDEHWKYYSEGDNQMLNKAKDLYLEALKYDSTFAQVYTGLAWVYYIKQYWDTFFSDDFLDSVFILSDMALSYDDKLSEAYTFKGMYYYQIGQTDKALKELDHAIQLNPNDWFAYMGKGNASLRTDLLMSIENYLKAATLNRGQQLLFLFGQLGWVYGHAGFREQAEYYIQEAYKLDRDSIRQYTRLFNLETTFGNYDKAIDMLNKHYAIDSGNVRINWNFVYIYTLLEEYEKALAWYKRILDPSKEIRGELGIFGLHRVGLAYWENGYKQEGEQYFNEQIRTLHEINSLGRGIGDSIRTSYDLAATYAFLGKKEKAYKYLEIHNKAPTRNLYNLNLIKNDPLFHSIRAESEFQQIVRDVEAKYKAEHERVRQWLEENDML